MTKKLCLMCNKNEVPTSRHKYCYQPCTPQRAYDAKHKKNKTMLADELARANKKIDYLETLLDRVLNRLESVGSLPSSSLGGVVALGELPQLEVTESKSEMVGSWNMTIQMNLGIDGDTRSLTDELVVYGLRELKNSKGIKMVQIMPHQVHAKHQHLLSGDGQQKHSVKKSGGLKKIETDYVPVAPDFDDLELDVAVAS